MSTPVDRNQAALTRIQAPYSGAGCVVGAPGTAALQNNGALG